MTEPTAHALATGRYFGATLVLLAAHAIAGPATAAEELVVAANGRLEGGQPTSTLHFAEAGRILAIAVVEGQPVRRGEVLARLDCSALEAELREAQAQFAIANRGGRAEAVATHRAEVDALTAEARRFEAHVRRLVNLAAKDLAAKSALEDAELQLRAVEARRMVAERALIQTRSALPAQERAAAAARVDALAARLKECQIIAPADGVVLRRLLEPGAAVSPVAPAPVLLFASTDGWHARAEVDEHDVGRIRVGQPTVVTAPGFGEAAVRGTVVRMSSLMGRRTVLSGDPAEKMDRDVREVLVRLARAPPAPVVGLRVKVKFLPFQAATPAASAVASPRLDAPPSSTQIARQNVRGP